MYPVPLLAAGSTQWGKYQVHSYPLWSGYTDSPKAAAQQWSLSKLFSSLLKLLSPLIFILFVFPLLHLVRPFTMAGSTLAIRKMAPSMQLSSMTRRSMSTQLALRAKPMRSTKLIQSVSRITRRGYADAASKPTPSPAPKPKKRFRALRWAWRLTWLSAIGLTGAVAYSIFDLRQPPDQAPPDPSKKTLVILGMYRSRLYPYSRRVANATVLVQELAGAPFPS